MAICKQFLVEYCHSSWIAFPLTSNILQNEFLLKCHPLSEFSMKAVRSGVRTPQTKYLGAVLAVSLISSIPATLWWFGRAVSVQRAHKYSAVFSACSEIDLRFVWCHLPFSSSLFLLSVCRKRGAILNISSASGMYPVPLLTVYSASKVIGIQSIWPFPHLLNWNLIIRDTPPCLIRAAVQRRSVRCLFSLGSYLLASCLPFQNVDMCPMHQLGVPLLARPARVLVCFAGMTSCGCSGILWVVGMTVWPSRSPASEAPPGGLSPVYLWGGFVVSLGNLALDFWSSTVTCFCSSYHLLAETVWQAYSIPRSLFIAFSDTCARTHKS